MDIGLTVALGGRLAELDRLWFVRFRVTIVPQRTLALPYISRGRMLRGAFGMSLRRLVCHDLSLECRTCPIEPTCAYPETFESRLPANADRLSHLQDTPRPFVFDPPPETSAEIPVGMPLSFGLTAIGRASRLVPYYVAALLNLAHEGLGPRRAPFDLAEVAAIDGQGRTTTVYRASDPLVRMDAPRLRVGDLLQPDDPRRIRIRLRFATPLEIKDQGVALHEPRLGPIVRRLRDRINMLSTFYADGPMDLDFKGLSALAETVEVREARTRQVSVKRRSSRTGRHHDIGGLVGEATYEGRALPQLLPLLRLGEVVHVGKHSAFGNGRMEIVG